jgi:S-formylglutathione hydrolase FrmB
MKTAGAALSAGRALRGPQGCGAILTLGVSVLLLALPASAQNLGHYERIRVSGPALAGNLEGDDPVRDVSVYLPPSYAGDLSRRYAVVYLLHGYTDSDDRWFGLTGNHFVNVPYAVDTAWEEGAAEMIIVMPNAFTKFQGSMYSNSVTTGDWEAFVAKDLVAYIDANYRTLAKRASRGLAGHSMGGYGSLRIGMKYPDVFASLYALSPCCMAPNLEPSPGLAAEAAAIDSAEEIAAASFGLKAILASAAAWSPNPLRPPHFLDLPVQDGAVDPAIVARWAANAPLVMVHQYVPQLKRFNAIRIDAGDQDRPIVDTVRELSAVLTGYGVRHIAEDYQGNHVNRIHDLLATTLMPMFSETLALE